MIREGEKLMLAVAGLLALGVMMVVSASYIKGMEKFKDPLFFFKRHILFVGVGIAGMIIILRVPIGFYRRFSYPLFFLSLIALGLVLIPHFGVKVHDSSRWLRIGGIRFQPSEFVKITYAIYLASVLSESHKRGVLYTLFMLFISGSALFCLLIMEPDYGTAAFFVLMTAIALFIYGIETKWLMLLGAVVCAVLIIFAVREEYRQKRLKAFLNPESYPAESFQMRQSLYAIGSGGIKGKGIGQGEAKYHFLPEPYTDYIFSVIGEELGFVGVILTLLAYYTFFKVGLRIALMSEDLFTTFLIALLTINIVIQALIHIGVTLGLLPSKGMTLPFVSYGGSSLISSCLSTGIIFRAWKEVEVG